jgi:acyl-CoA synthetase (AMP-forming)/AMP-acid ligase II
MVRYKIPKRIEFATVLPTSGYGKVTTALLEEEFRKRNSWPSEA